MNRILVTPLACSPVRPSATNAARADELLFCDNAKAFQRLSRCSVFGNRSFSARHGRARCPHVAPRDKTALAGQR